MTKTKIITPKSSLKNADFRGISYAQNTIKLVDFLSSDAIKREANNAHLEGDKFFISKMNTIKEECNIQINKINKSIADGNPWYKFDEKQTAAKSVSGYCIIRQNNAIREATIQDAKSLGIDTKLFGEHFHVSLPSTQELDSVSECLERNDNILKYRTHALKFAMREYKQRIDNNTPLIGDYSMLLTSEKALVNYTYNHSEVEALVKVASSIIRLPVLINLIDTVIQSTLLVLRNPVMLAAKVYTEETKKVIDADDVFSKETYSDEEKLTAFKNKILAGLKARVIE